MPGLPTHLGGVEVFFGVAVFLSFLNKSFLCLFFLFLCFCWDVSTFGVFLQKLCFVLVFGGLFLFLFLGLFWGRCWTNPDDRSPPTHEKTGLGRQASCPANTTCRRLQAANNMISVSQHETGRQLQLGREVWELGFGLIWKTLVVYRSLWVALLKISKKGIANR